MPGFSFVFDPVAVHGLAATLAILLLFGAWQKLRDPLMFSAAIEDYRLLPGSWAPVLAFCMPVTEAAAGIMLLLPKTAPTGGATALLVLSLATGAVVVNLLRGRRDIDCGCGGLSHQPLSWALVSRNLALMAAIVVVMHGEVERGLVWLDYLTVAATVLALFGLYAVFNQLLANRPATPVFR
jgi:hypothetical protein